ncbi:hypothetical protein H4W32_000166 [Actinophytocola algeriensis]|uniref:Alpha/beta hydrolase family protein n=1 Tax=Actinophytocola algeriensis TaxID=1768010 RepID=A0A7W7Q3M9_9PSEU|nr:hypothetical protein [Actinophytocola algeriensis]MBE1472124.1 hypothetical protein [Actinophytocola algeriensis]
MTSLPIVLTHGWPSTFLELTDLARRLAEPSKHGGDASDAFTVVVPSLPGYAFSPRRLALPPTLQTHQVWHRLMRDELGFDRYAAHGGSTLKKPSVTSLRSAPRRSAPCRSIPGNAPPGKWFREARRRERVGRGSHRSPWVEHDTVRSCWELATWRPVGGTFRPARLAPADGTPSRHHRHPPRVCRFDSFGRLNAGRRAVTLGGLSVKFAGNSWGCVRDRRAVPGRGHEFRQGGFCR